MTYQAISEFEPVENAREKECPSGWNEETPPHEYCIAPEAGMTRPLESVETGGNEGHPHQKASQAEELNRAMMAYVLAAEANAEYCLDAEDNPGRHYPVAARR